MDGQDIQDEERKEVFTSNIWGIPGEGVNTNILGAARGNE